MDEGGLVDGEVVKGEVLGKAAVSERYEVDGAGAHLVADVVEADLPADHVLDGLDDNLGDMGVSYGGGCGEAVVGRPDRHAIVAAEAGVRVGIAGGKHIDGEGRCLDGPRRQGAGKKQAAGTGDEGEKQECRSSDEPLTHRPLPFGRLQSVPDGGQRGGASSGLDKCALSFAHARDICQEGSLTDMYQSLRFQHGVS